MLRYFLTLLSTLALIGVITITPKYWGALETKRLNGIVLGGLIFAALAIWAIFRELKEDGNLNVRSGQIIKRYLFYVAQYSSFILFFSMAAWFLSLGTHWLLSALLSKTIIDGISVLLFCLFFASVIWGLNWVSQKDIV